MPHRSDVEAPLTMYAPDAARYLGLGVRKVRRFARAGLIPNLVDPDTGRRHFFRPALDRWAADNGRTVA